MENQPRVPAWLPWIVGALAALQTLFTGAAVWSSVSGWCPLDATHVGCAALSRARVGSVGPVSLTGAAAVGAMALWVAVPWLALGRTLATARPVVAGVAGVSLGLQVYGWSATGSVCPLCAGIAATWCAAAACWRGRRGQAAGVFVGVCVVVSSLGWWGGQVLRRADAARLEALREVGGEGGVQLVLYTRAGCPFCHAFQVDTLGDPRVLAVLEGTRGVRVEEVDGAEQRRLGLRGVPTLEAVGEERARLEGYVEVAGVLVWLQEEVGVGR